MENLEKILKPLFRGIPSQSIIMERISGQGIGRKDFVQLAFAYNKQYSENELNNLWYYYRDVLEREDGKRGIRPRNPDKLSAFDGLFYYVKRMLTIYNNEVVCKYNYLMQWRMMTLNLSEDILVSAYWAQEKIPMKMSRIGFTWDVVIGHNNTQLNRIFEKGISENHFHLYGSTPMFHLTWLSLMNNLMGSQSTQLLQQYDRNRQDTRVQFNIEIQE